ncbi:MAG: hypothetical protein B6D68_00715 [spirochete symbiont of Stewartia floridana]|nr:MAG: hypothetical protein B6D68_00715 [spirochete symbiont of Stewartia floridana]
MKQTGSISSQAADLFARLNWPSVQEEAWRRTDLGRLLPKGLLDETAAHSCGRRLDAAEDYDTPALPKNFAARVILHAHRPVAITISEEAESAGLVITWVSPDNLSPGLLAMGQEELDQNPNRITAWHWRDVLGVLVIQAPENACIEAPIFIEEHLLGGISEDFLFCAPHLHVETGIGAALNIVWGMEGFSTPGNRIKPVVNANLTCSADANSRVRVILRQNLGDDAVFFFSGNLRVKDHGKICFTESHLGGLLVKTHTRVLLGGEGADAVLKGLFAAEEGRHIDIGTDQDHCHPHGTSYALYKGAVKGGGRAVFQGLIQVKPDAKKTDAYLTNKNLILGDGARADSMPQLDILTDDVRCSHGSTTGKLDEGQLFYLQSRGYNREEAVLELTRAFLAETLEGLPESVAVFLVQDIDYALEKG